MKCMIPGRRSAVPLLILLVGWCMWAVLAIVTAERIASDYSRHAGPMPCPLPRDDSASGRSSWSWNPPGQVCHDLTGRVTSSPDSWRSYASIVVLAGLLTLAIATATLAYRRRGSGDSSSAETLDELISSDQVPAG
jgi:hypothetical protein